MCAPHDLVGPRARPRHSDITALTRSSLVRHTHTLTYVRQQSYTKHGHSSAPLSWYDPTQAVGASRDTRGAAAGAENLGVRRTFAHRRSRRDVNEGGAAQRRRTSGYAYGLSLFTSGVGIRRTMSHVVRASWLWKRARSRCKTYI